MDFELNGISLTTSQDLFRIAVIYIVRRPQLSTHTNSLTISITTQSSGTDLKGEALVYKELDKSQAMETHASNLS